MAKSSLKRFILFKFFILLIPTFFLPVVSTDQKHPDTSTNEPIVLLTTDEASPKVNQFVDTESPSYRNLRVQIVPKGGSLLQVFDSEQSYRSGTSSRSFNLRNDSRAIAEILKEIGLTRSLRIKVEADDLEDEGDFEEADAEDEGEEESDGDEQRRERMPLTWREKRRLRLRRERKELKKNRKRRKATKFEPFISFGPNSGIMIPRWGFSVIAAVAMTGLGVLLFKGYTYRRELKAEERRMQKKMADRHERREKKKEKRRNCVKGR